MGTTATIVYHKGERAFIEATLSGQVTLLTPTIIPALGANWGVGLGTRVGGVGINKADGIAQILEVGTATANGYARATLARNHTGWPAATLPGSFYTATAPQQTFTFTGTPSPNSATLWFVAGTAVINDDNVLFGADLAEVRVYSGGDIQRITPSYSQE